MDKELLHWFCEKYNLKNFGIAFREYKTNSIIKNGKRYIVRDIYPKKIDGCYFHVYKNTPIKEKVSKADSLYDSPLEEYNVQF
jgi:hypothetical protein